MKKTVVVVGIVGAIAAVACGSESTGASCDVEGTWSITSTKESGNCDERIGAKTVDVGTYQFVRQPNGGYVATMQGLMGSFPVKVDGCRVTVAIDVTAGSTVIGTNQATYTVDGDKLTGFSASTVGRFALADGGTFAGCTFNTTESGVRR
jgi:hypothetical protein